MSLAKAMYLENKIKRADELQDMIDNHDCHLTLEDGCDCQDWRLELMGLSYPYQTP